MENRNGLLRQRSVLWRSLRDGDFEEEDVWAVLRDHRTESISKVGKIKESSLLSSTSAKMIPRSSNGRNSEFEAKIVQQSAPINIPDWSKVYNHKSKKAHHNSSWHDDDDDQDNDDDCGFVNGCVDSDGEEEEEDDDDDDEYDDKLPPHELINRRLARSQISSFSVFEGAGRTLKGRDLSKVRNAVLAKTGFLESL